MAKRRAAIFLASEADLEATFLHECLDAFYRIFGDALFSVVGEAPEQNIELASKSAFELFVIRVNEVMAMGSCVKIKGKKENHSLLSAGVRFAERHPEEARASGLDVAQRKLDPWLGESVSFTFWTGDEQISFPLLRRDLFYFVGNARKHNLLRLGALLGRLLSLCRESKPLWEEDDAIRILPGFLDEAESRLVYHASNVAELMFDFLYSVWKIADARYQAHPTKDERELQFPAGLTSGVTKRLYSDALWRASGGVERLLAFRPCTTKFLKLRY